MSLSSATPFEIAPCAICGCEVATTAYVGFDRLHGLPGKFTLVKCCECGLVYLRPRPSKEAIAAYYPDDYLGFRSSSQSEGTLLAGLDAVLSRRKRCGVVLRYKKRGKLVDVGCATGNFLFDMRSYPGWEVYGVEVNHKASLHCREHLGIDVITGDLLQARFKSASVDVVTFWDVLEHIHNPRDVLDECNRILVDKGILLVTVPNLNSIDASIFGDSWAGLDFPRHLYVFSRDTIEKLLNQSGFEVVDTLCLTGRQHSFALSLQFLAVDKVGNAKRVYEFAIKALRFPPARILCFPYFYLADAFKLGSSITVVARKC